MKRKQAFIPIDIGKLENNEVKIEVEIDLNNKIAHGK